MNNIKALSDKIIVEENGGKLVECPGCNERWIIEKDHGRFDKFVEDRLSCDSCFDDDSRPER